MNDEYIAEELGRIKAVLSKLIAWIAQSSVGCLSVEEAALLLDSLDSKK